MIVGRDGVPELIQGLRYRYGDMSFKAYFFNGKSLTFPSEFACPSIGLMQQVPTRMQELEAQNRIEKFVLENYGRLWTA